MKHSHKLLFVINLCATLSAFCAITAQAQPPSRPRLDLEESPRAKVTAAVSTPQPYDQTGTLLSTIAKVGVERVAPKVDYLSAWEQEIVHEINLARTNPKEYAAHLEQLKRYYVGQKFRQPGGAVFMTNESLSAVEEAINFLRSTSPVPPLKVSKGMSLGAKEHVNDLGPRGNTGHKGTDASLVEQRVNRFGSWRHAIGESIAYNVSTARDVVSEFIIDDGVPGRGHRKDVFNSAYHTIGVACGNHASLETVCVITYAGGFSEQAAPNAARKF